MKATLATLACLLTVGFLSAAEVVGNNTAVVIRKEVVKSDNGYQFLCVPVDGLDITNGNTQTVKLSTLLPPATLANGTTVTIGQTQYTVADGAWSVDPDMEGGTIFWVKDPTASSGAQTQSLAAMLMSGAVVAAADDSGSAAIVFCGQDRSRTIDTPVAKKVVAMKNDSSVAVALKDLGIEGVKAGDQILTIMSGSSEYNIYRYSGGKWYGPGFANDCSNVEIAPGEAYYYFCK